MRNAQNPALFWLSVVLIGAVLGLLAGVMAENEKRAPAPARPDPAPTPAPKPAAGDAPPTDEDGAE